MKTYQIYIYGKLKSGSFCRLIFLIDDEDQEQFLRAETKKNILTPQMEMSHFEAVKFINDNKLRLIDEFKIRI